MAMEFCHRKMGESFLKTYSFQISDVLPEKLTVNQMPFSFDDCSFFASVLPTNLNHLPILKVIVRAFLLYRHLRSTFSTLLILAVCT